MMPARTSDPEVRGARERIIDAAIQVFGELGYTRATTREIARRAQVNEVTIFRIFKTKAELFRTSIQERSLIGEISAHIQMPEETSIDEALYQNMAFVLALLRKNAHMIRLVLGDASSNPEVGGLMSDLALVQGVQIVSHFITRLMERGLLRQGDPEMTARAMMGMVQSYFIFNDLIAKRRIDGEQDERALRTFVVVFLDGTRGGG
jgi:AcrR family transcriptional regulator